MKKVLLAVLLFAFVGFSVPSLSLGQTPNGTIVGVVTDSTGGSVVGATVTRRLGR